MVQKVNPKALPEVKALDRLVGTWKISGGADGIATYEWMEGGYFLMQHTVMGSGEQAHKAVDIIGYEKRADEDETERLITSRSYSNKGLVSNYTYELKDDTLTIWYGNKGSANYSKSVFSEDGNTLTGAWKWPGGGYEFVMTRMNE
jgi:hypothetical protein